MARSLLKPICTVVVRLAWVLGMMMSAWSVYAEEDAPRVAQDPADPVARDDAPVTAFGKGQRLDAPPEPEVIQRLRTHGFAVKPVGVIGRELPFWLLRAPDGEESLVITTPEGFLIRGQIYAPDGSLNLDTEGHPPVHRSAERRHALGFAPVTGLPPATEAHSGSPVKPAPSRPTPAGTVWDQLGQATIIEEGVVGAPLVYIFIDPYCPYCHQQWSALRPSVRQGKLRIRWVPVAVLRASQQQLGIAQGLLRDPSAETLADWMRNQRVRTDDSEATQVALARNMALFLALKVPSVPAIIYKDSTGQLVKKVGLTEL